MNNLFIFFKMVIKIAESALKLRVGRVSGNTGIFFLGLILSKNIFSASNFHMHIFNMWLTFLQSVEKIQ